MFEADIVLVLLLAGASCISLHRSACHARFSYTTFPVHVRPSIYTANMTSPAPEKKYTMAVKAYKNPDFLNSGHARFIRVMCEYEVRLNVEWAMWRPCSS